jgi:hypothetical protein
LEPFANVRAFFEAMSRVGWEKRAESGVWVGGSGWEWNVTRNLILFLSSEFVIEF